MDYSRHGLARYNIVQITVWISAHVDSEYNLVGANVEPHLDLIITIRHLLEIKAWDCYVTTLMLAFGPQHNENPIAAFTV